MTTLTFVRRDADKAYLDSNLWIPKNAINVEGTKNVLSIASTDDHSARVFYLFKDVGDHLVVPRNFYKPENLPADDIVDMRPRSYPRTVVHSHITLDAQNPGLTTQRDALKALMAVEGGILQLRCGGGKAQPVDTPVLTPDGWQNIGTLRPGDLVIGSDGNAVRVTGVYPQGVRRVFRVRMDDGTSTRCCAEHLWFTQTPHERWQGCAGSVKSTEEVQKSVRTRAGAKHAIPRVREVSFAPQEPMLSPWLLGFYLGDGSSGKYNGARRIQFDKALGEALTRVSEELQQLGCTWSHTADKRNKNTTIHVKFERGNTHPLWELLTETGLMGLESHEKFIPQTYMRSSVSERWELLNGLLAADGSLHRRARTYSTSSPRLRDDVAQLVRSLGGRVTIEARQTHFTYNGVKKPGRPSWRLYITHPKFGGGRYDKHYIQSVEGAGEAECVCIAVDAPDHLYVTEDFILTHNTVIGLHLIAQLQVPALIAVPDTTLMEQWRKAIGEHLEVPDGIGLIQADSFDWKKPIVLATYHTLANRALTFPEDARRWFGVALFDEGHHLPAEKWSQAAGLIYGRRYVFTATPERSDGMHVINQMHIGPVLYKNLKQELTPEIQFMWTGFEADILQQDVREQVCDVTGEIHLGMLARYLGGLRERLEFIISGVKQLRDQGRRILVISSSTVELANLMSLWCGVDLLTEQAPITPESVGFPGVIPRAMEARIRDNTLAEIDAIENKIAQLSKVRNEAPVHAAQTAKTLSKLQKDLARHKGKLMARDCYAAITREELKRFKAHTTHLLDIPSDAGLLVGAVSAAKRFKMLREKQVIFSIAKYGREGLDEKRLDTLVVCEPMSDAGLLRQVLGRIQRLAPKHNKHKGLAVFLEDNIGPHIGMCNKLRKHLNNIPEEDGGKLEFSMVGYPTGK